MHILIIDDHAGSAAALLAVVEQVVVSTFPDAKFVTSIDAHKSADEQCLISTVSSFYDGMALAMAGEFPQRPSVIFLDLTLPDVEDFDPLQRMRVVARIGAKIFVWSGASYTDEVLRGSWKTGASGWISKGLSPEALQDAVRCALQLGFYMPDDPAAPSVSAVLESTSLSPSELQLARLIALDLNLQTIAEAHTDGSLREATTQVAELCGKMGVLTLPEAALRARAMGIK